MQALVIVKGRSTSILQHTQQTLCSRAASIASGSKSMVSSHAAVRCPWLQLIALPPLQL